MVDTDTKKRIIVYAEGPGSPYLIVPVEQMDDVVRLLDEIDSTYVYTEDAISVDGKPAVNLITLTEETDTAKVQQALDNAE